MSSADERVLLDLNNFPKAQELFRAALSGKYRVIVYGGAIRGGKSYNLLGVLAVLLRMNPGSRAAIVRRDLPTLKRNTLPTCQKVFPPDFMGLVDRTSYVWKCYSKKRENGSAFFFPEQFERDKELTRWDGLEVNYFMLDQIEELNEKSFYKAIERCGSYFIPGMPASSQPPPLILASVNPTRNWVRRVVYDRWRNGTLPDDWLYIPALITDNPHVPKSYLDSLKSLKFTNPSEYERRVEGSWDYTLDDLMLYDPEAIGDIPHNSFVAGGQRYITADVAMEGADQFVLMVWDGWRVIDVVVREKITDSGQILNLIRQKARQWKVPRSNIVYDADGVGAFINTLKGAKPFKGNASPVKIPGVGRKAAAADKRPNYLNLRSQAYYTLASKIRSRELYVPLTGPQEDMLVEELSAIHRKTMASGKLAIQDKEYIKRIIGRSPDFADNLAMRTIFDLKRRRSTRTTGTA